MVLQGHGDAMPLRRSHRRKQAQSSAHVSESPNVMTTFNRAHAHVETQTRTDRKSRGVSLESQERMWGWIFLSPWLIGFLLFTLLPMLASLLFSFTNFNLTQPGQIQFIGFANYQKLFQDPFVAESLSATIHYGMIALPASIILPLALAALLNAKNLWGKRFFRTLFYMPYIVPAVSAAYIWNGYLNTDSGWLNRALGLFGIQGPNWLFDTRWIYPALFIVGLWVIGNAMLTTLAAMQTVPTELYEAAKVDGAGAVRTYFSITLPMISPVIFYNLILSLIGLFRYFDIPYILTNGSGQPGNATMFYNIYLYRVAFRFQDMGYGATLAWALFAIALVITILVFLSARYWVYYAGGED